MGMALSKRAADEVAKEKERAALDMGHSPGKARRYADEVREYAKKERQRERREKER